MTVYCTPVPGTVPAWRIVFLRLKPKFYVFFTIGSCRKLIQGGTDKARSSR